ncbi:MAG: 4-(cytidine 5'-diphospho)-2-C-methyl-D-erythritol kinase [Pirellulales bacterium]
MFVREVAGGVEVWTPAKLNLFFEVLAKRTDGFHEIETLMVPVDIYDTLTVENDPAGRLELSCGWVRQDNDRASDSPGALPADADNLAIKAVDLLRRRCGEGRGARLRLAKRIPAAAGLGGASSDAAAALVAANRVWRLGLSVAKLAELAAELGSDVPFFLYGGPAICRGRGERIEPLAGLGVFDAAIVRPPVGLATADVYGRCRPADTPRRVTEIVDALRRGDLAATGAEMVNRLEPAAASLSPWVERLHREFAAADCVAAQLTGSGSCYFGLCRSARHARSVAARLRSADVGTVFVVRSLGADGCRALDMH